MEVSVDREIIRLVKQQSCFEVKLILRIQYFGYYE